MKKKFYLLRRQDWLKGSIRIITKPRSFPGYDDDIILKLHIILGEIVKGIIGEVHFDISCQLIQCTIYATM